MPAAGDYCARMDYNAGMPERDAVPYLELIVRHLPDFADSQARILPATGQFNTVLCLDERWIFRFPKSSQVAAELAHELELLPRLGSRLPLPIPQPQLSAFDGAGRALFMGYAMLPGQPLLRERYAQLKVDAPAVERIARDLADFLPALRRRLPRARFYRGNYALIQALYALRDNDQAEFEDGIRDYV